MGNEDVKLVNKDSLVIANYMESYFKNTKPDCTLISEEGFEVYIHQEVLYQTKFMCEMLKSLERCCSKVEIFLPSLTKEDLEKIVRFMYTGEIACYNRNEVCKLAGNLTKLFGFPNHMEYVTKIDIFDEIEISPKEEFSSSTNDNGIVQQVSPAVVCDENLVGLIDSETNSESPKDISIKSDVEEEIIESVSDIRNLDIEFQTEDVQNIENSRSKANNSKIFNINSNSDSDLSETSSSLNTKNVKNYQAHNKSETDKCDFYTKEVIDNPNQEKLPQIVRETIVDKKKLKELSSKPLTKKVVKYLKKGLNFKCSKCDAVFSKIPDLDNHFSAIHDQNYNSGKVDQEETKESLN